MTQYFIAESQRYGKLVQSHWTPVDAANFDEAKKAAESAQCFQGTSVWVGERNDEAEVSAIAVKDDGDEWYGFFPDVAL